MLERDYQTQLIKKLRRLFPGCIVLKNDTSYLQGVPDLTILYGDRWAMLEVKASRTSRVRPNQTHYVEEIDRMSFCAFVYPENEEYVLNELQQALGSRRSARIPQRI